MATLGKIILLFGLFAIVWGSVGPKPAKRTIDDPKDVVAFLNEWIDLLMPLQPKPDPVKESSRYYYRYGSPSPVRGTSMRHICESRGKSWIGRKLEGILGRRHYLIVQNIFNFAVGMILWVGFVLCVCILVYELMHFFGCVRENRGNGVIMRDWVPVYCPRSNNPPTTARNHGA